MDSGAAQSVAPPSMGPGVSIEASPGSQRGQHYVSASGGRLPNMGQQKLRVQTNEGRDAMVLYQIAEVSRPLTAVSQTCGNDNWVVYTRHGGFIWNLKTGGKTNFERRGGIYEFDLWVKDADLIGGSPATRLSPAGTLLSSKTREEGRTSLRSVCPLSQRESANACVIPISPVVRKKCEPPDKIHEVMGG